MDHGRFDIVTGVTSHRHLSPGGPQQDGRSRTAGIRVRRFGWDDHDAVVAMWQAAGLDVVPRAELEGKLTRDPHLFLVAENGPDLAGVVMGSYDGRRGWIFRLAVSRSHRRRGIATLLVAELETRFGELGCPRINLLVTPGNAAGLHFWQARGYLPYPDVLCSKPLTGDRPSRAAPSDGADQAVERGLDVGAQRNHHGDQATGDHGGEQ